MNTLKKILLNPGPVTLTDRVRKSLLKDDLCHREDDFSSLLIGIKEKILKVYDLGSDFDAVILAGSGTAAVESMLKSFVGDQDKTLVLSNGVYGERMATMLQRDNKKVKNISNDWLNDVNFEELEKELNTSSYTRVVCVHNETTTGRLNDINRVLALCEKHKVPLMLDAVSSFGAENINFNSPYLHCVASTANKCLHGITGAAFVVARNESFKLSKDNSSSLYLDLFTYWKNQKEGWCPFTPSVHSLYAFDEALDELSDNGGYKQRNAIYKGIASSIRKTLNANDIPLLIDEPSYSSMISSFLIPENKKYNDIYNQFIDKNFVIYSGQGTLANKIFRICNMGDITDVDLERLIDQTNIIFS